MGNILYIVIPCYNEEEVLPITGKLFIKKLDDLKAAEKIDKASKVLFVNDGSSDNTWNVIKDYSENYECCCGIALSKNCGHQNALFAGLMEAKKHCDMTISIDCDGQDDIDAIDKMVDKYLEGNEIVYGVRDNRDTDSVFKRTTANGYYFFLEKLGDIKVIKNHADYRLMSKRVLDELENYKEVNLYLRGLIPNLGFKSDIVYYKREERKAGKTHYPFKKMMALAIDGITSFSVKPIRFIAVLGLVIAFISFISMIYIFIGALMGNTVKGWASVTCILVFVSGLQMMCMGIIGEYIAKIYMETKGRPKYIIETRVNIEDIKN